MKFVILLLSLICLGFAQNDTNVESGETATPTLVPACSSSTIVSYFIAVTSTLGVLVMALTAVLAKLYTLLKKSKDDKEQLMTSL